MSDSTDILQPLTDAQREAVTHVDGPLLILAGPGSGKTRVVTHRIAYLLDQGVRPSQILGLTFTNKAADEMLRRVQTLRPGRQVWLSTFHRWCANLLRRYAEFAGLQANYTILDTQDSLATLKRALKNEEISTGTESPERIMHEISRCKNQLITPQAYASPELFPANLNMRLWELVKHAYPAYQASLQRNNAVDFDDLLFHVANLLSDNPALRSELDARFRYIMVDEYQDTNHAQYTLLRALSLDFPNLAATGDPDQSIYGWRGANLNNILNFERDFGDVQVVRLEQNYRSTPPILHVADELISRNQMRKRKSLYTTREGGAPVRLACYVDQHDESDSIADIIAREMAQGRSPAEFAIFYRINALSRSFETALRQRNIPYQVVSGLEFYQRKEVKDCLAYLQLINNPRDDTSLLRIINTPARRIGKTTVDRLALYSFQHGQSLLDTTRQAGLVPKVSKQAAVHVAKFAALIDGLRELVHEPVEVILEQALERTGLRADYLQSDDPLDDERLANIDELVSAAREFDASHSGGDPLQAFLEQSLLINDTDALDPDADRVTLMTLHAAKGLEFPTVFITAVEENLLPHERSKRDEHQLEEERRLFFVGITRAMRELQISYTRYRAVRGEMRTTIPSSFLIELPRHTMEVVGTSSMRAAVPRRARSDADHADAWDDEWSDDDSDHDDDTAHSQMADFMPPPTRVRGPSDSAARRPGISGLTTAADLLNDGQQSDPQPAAAVDVSRFRAGSTVIHPQFGVGKIVAIEGTGEETTATVNFALVPGERKFLLATSGLKSLVPREW
ncbi:MAG: 3'-5' exonuclease [Pirellulales bacterium]